MEPGAPSYIDRSADVRLLETLLAGEYVFVLDSRQKGKSSLVARTLERLREQDVSAVRLDLQRIGANLSAEQWYAGLLAGIGAQLRIDAALFDYWRANQQLGPLARWLGALEHVVLPSVSGRLLIFIDEIDFVRALPFSADEFFAGIRDCYGRRSGGTGFERLSFCLVGAATPSQLVRNAEISPFNIGIRVSLTDFTRVEAMAFAAALDGPGREGRALVDAVHEWVGGHPYLTQLLCSEIASDSAVRSRGDVDRLVERLFLTHDARRHEPNFIDVERRLLESEIPGLSDEERQAQLLDLYGSVLHGRAVEAAADSPLVETLRLSGLGADEGGRLRVRNRLYRRVFDERWRRQRLPDAERRRQRSAARAAALRTGLVATVVVLAVSASALGMWRLSNDRQRSLDTLQQRTNELARVSGERERALSDLGARTRQLDKAAAERERSYLALQEQSDVLKRLAEEKQSALDDLRARTRELLYQTYAGGMGTARIEMAEQRWTRMSQLVDRLADNPERGWEWGYLALSVDHGGLRRAFPKWSVLETQPDGRVLVLAQDGLYDPSSPSPRRVAPDRKTVPTTPFYRRGPFRVQEVDATRGAAIFDAATGRQLVKNRNYSMIYDIDPKRRRYLLFQGMEDSTVVELRGIDGDRVVASYKGPDQANAGTFLPDGSYLCIFATPKEGVGEVVRFDRSGKVLDSAPSAEWYAHGIAASADGSLYAAYGDDAKVEIRRLKGHERTADLPDHPKSVTDLVFSKDGSQVLTGCEDGVVRLFDVASGTLLRSLRGLTYAIHQVAFLPSGKGWCAIDREGRFQSWRREIQPELEEFRDHKSRIGTAWITPDGGTLISTAGSGNVVSRNLATGAVVVRKLVKTLQVPHVCTVPGRDLYWIRPDRGIERLDARTLKTLAVADNVFPDPVVSVTPMDGGKRLFVCGAKRTYAVLDTKTMRILKRIAPKPKGSGFDALGVKIDDQFAIDQTSPVFAIFQGDVGEILLFSSTDGTEVARCKPRYKVMRMTLAEGGRELVSCEGVLSFARDGRTMIYDTRTGRPAGELKHPGLTMLWPQYSEATGILATMGGGNSNIVFLWDVKRRIRLGQFQAEPRTTEFSISPDGKRIVTNSPDGTVAIWDSRTGEQYLKLPYPWPIRVEPYGWGAAARFSPDGRRLVLLSTNGWVRLLNSAPWEEATQGAR